MGSDSISVPLDRMGGLSLVSYFWKEWRLQIKSVHYPCLCYANGIRETVQSHTP